MNLSTDKTIKISINTDKTFGSLYFYLKLLVANS